VAQGHGILRTIRAGGLVLALVAFALKAILPAGYMLDARAGLAIEICGSDGAWYDAAAGEIVYGAKPAHEPSDNSGSGQDSEGLDQHCPYALMGAPALFEPSALLVAPRFAFVVAPSARVDVVSAAGVSGPPLPARGPPNLA
jgi:hypothetical protein